jgi:3'(2'), 5'-bisphosphate nucleotidase
VTGKTERAAGITAHGRPSALLVALAALAEEAGQAILAVRARGCEALAKGDGSPVTEADLAADAIIQAGLAQLAPGTAVVSEETVARPLEPGAPFFLVDPLDGTKEFVAGQDGFTVNIARIDGGRPTLGAIHVPVSGATYVGEVGAGAWRRTPGGAFEPMAVRPCGREPVAVVSLSHLDPKTRVFLETHQIRHTRQVSSSLKFCLVAEGAGDIYPRFGPTMEWDTAAGDAIATAAGATMRALDGTAFVYGKQAQGFLNGGFVLAGPGAEPGAEPAADGAGAAGGALSPEY